MYRHTPIKLNTTNQIFVMWGRERDEIKQSDWPHGLIKSINNCTLWPLRVQINTCILKLNMPHPLRDSTHHDKELPEEVQKRKKNLFLSVVCRVWYFSLEHFEDMIHRYVEEEGTSSGEVTETNVRQAISSCGNVNKTITSIVKTAL